jgi:hypothetical protein
MIVVASFLAVGEALVARSSLAAAGIPSHLGSWPQTSLSPNSVALGGMRLWIPLAAHADASEVLRAMPGDTPHDVLLAFRRRVWRFLLAWCGAAMALGLVTALLVESVLALLYSALFTLATPLGMTVPPPPWRGDYDLVPAESG